MKEDLLFDALSDVKDEYIKEAAVYGPKAKVITPKRILALASCIAIVAVSAFAISKFTSPSVLPTATAPTYAAIDTTDKKQDEALTYPAIATTYAAAGTEIATEIGETEIAIDTTPGTTAGALLAPEWEERHITSKFGIAEVNGKRYTYSSTEAEYEELEKVLCYATLTGTDYLNDNKVYETDVIVYKLKDFSDELFVAVKFEEDDSFYVYECGTYKPEDVKDFLSDTSFEKYISMGEGYQVFHETRGPVVSSVTMSDTTDEIISALVELLKSNPDVKAYEAPYNDANEHISFGFQIKDYDCHAHFNENGRLALSVGGFFYFDFTGAEFDEFIKLVEKNEKGKKPLSTVTEVSTAQTTEHPNGVVTSPPVPPTGVEPSTAQQNEVVTFPPYNPQVSTTAAPPFIPTETYLNEITYPEADTSVMP